MLWWVVTEVWQLKVWAREGGRKEEETWDALWPVDNFLIIGCPI